jgi:hypothetical protein
MISNSIKQYISLIAVILTFISYIPYYRDILRNKTQPHIYSWSLWGLLTILIVALQIKGGAGSATYVTATAGLLCIGVVILGLKNGKRDITKSDTVVAILGLVAIGFWLIVKQPVISIILIVVADILAFIPTVRKSWHKPHSETLSLYITNTFRFFLAFLAIKEYTILSSLWLVVWIIVSGLFSIMLVLRRKTISKKLPPIRLRK